MIARINISTKRQVKIRAIQRAFKKLLFSLCFKAILKAFMRETIPFVAANKVKKKPKDKISTLGFEMISIMVEETVSKSVVGNNDFKNSIICTSSSAMGMYGISVNRNKIPGNTAKIKLNETDAALWSKSKLMILLYKITKKI